MKTLRKISVILFVLITLPIWFYLYYKILQAVNATELMWFLYWIYLPACIISTIITKIIEGEVKD